MAGSLGAVAARLLVACSEALRDDGRPVCKVYQTHGIPIIPFCCECDDPELGEDANGEISIHFRRLFDADPTSIEEVRRLRPCRSSTTAAQFRIVLARCRPIINQDGEIPTPEELTEHTLDQLRDVELLWYALANSDEEIRIDDVSPDLSEPGTCAVIYADLSVRVDANCPPGEFGTGL